MQLTADHYVGTDTGVRHAMSDFLAGLSFVAVMTAAEVLMWYDEHASMYRLISVRDTDSSPEEVAYATRLALVDLSCEHFNRLCGGDVTVSAAAICERTMFTMSTADSKAARSAMRAFMGAVEAMEPAERRRLLQFWTGASSLADNARLEVALVATHDRGRLPNAHTCYMQLVLHYPASPPPTPAEAATMCNSEDDGVEGAARAAEVLQHLRTAIANASIIYDE